MPLGIDGHGHAQSPLQPPCTPQASKLTLLDAPTTAPLSATEPSHTVAIVGTEFGESINPTLDALWLFAAVLLLASIPLDLLIAPSALPVSFLIALVPFAKTRYVHSHLHANPDGVLGRALQPLRHDHPRLPSGAGAVALKRGESSQQPARHRIAKPQGCSRDCFREPPNDCQPGSGTFARSPPRFHCLCGQGTL